MAEPPGETTLGTGGLAEIVNSPVTVTATVAVWVMEPLVPVTVIVYVPAGVEAAVLIVRMEVADPPGLRGIVLGLNEVVRPVAEGGTDAVSPTVPAKPALLRVMVEVAELPATKLAGLAVLAVTVKSAVTVTDTLAMWDREPLVPVTVTVYVPAAVEVVVEIVRMDVPVPPGVKLMVATLSEAARPVAEGETDAVRPTLASRPRLLRVMVEVAEPPAMKLLGLAGLAEMVKSGVTVTVRMAVWDTDVPLMVAVPVTVIV